MQLYITLKAFNSNKTLFDQMMETSLSTNLKLTRKSFRSHQQLRRNCSRPIICASALLTFFIYLLALTMGLFSSEEIQQKKVPIQLSATQAYLSQYCNDEDACSGENIEAITAILSLLQNTNFTHLASSQISSNDRSLQKRSQEPEQTSSNFREPLSNGIQFAHQSEYKHEIQRIQNKMGNSRLVDLPLQVIRHPKVTTPIFLTFTQKISKLFSTYDPYEKVDKITQKDNHLVWKTNTETISIGVRSNKPIRVTTVEINLDEVDKEQLQLIGLTVTLDQKAILTTLAKQKVKKGVNRINCLSAQCKEYYDAVIFRMGQANVISIKVFQSQQITVVD